MEELEIDLKLKETMKDVLFDNLTKLMDKQIDNFISKKAVHITSDCSDYGGEKYHCSKKDYERDILVLISFYYMELTQQCPSAYPLNQYWMDIQKIELKELTYCVSCFTDDINKICGEVSKDSTIYKCNYDGNGGVFFIDDVKKDYFIVIHVSGS